ncbi:MAG: hypothetical protein OER04_16430 [Cyclobacteriaceae bacterium]|nr:hypothetical protein [Cyclobacteriaceae bacterium]
MKFAIILLRIGVFGTFLGHGILALLVNPHWIKYLEFWGFSENQAETLMPIIGIVDILVALTVLIRPIRYILLYAAIWGLLTALMRPLVGESWLQFVERAANWAAPAGLYALLYLKK